MEKSINDKEQCVQTDVMQSVLKQNDCRYGNYIIYGGSITQLNEKEMTHFFRFSETYKPIPLTEEWLLKFGFELKYGCFLLSTNRGTILIEEDLAQISSVISHDGFMSPCKYVHQLQNLYFALTGSELTVA